LQKSQRGGSENSCSFYIELFGGKENFGTAFGFMASYWYYLEGKSNMKQVMILAVLLYCTFAAGCSYDDVAQENDAVPEASGEPTATSAAESDQLPYCPIAIVFDSEEQLLDTIKQSKSIKSAGPDDKILIIESDSYGKQSYGAESDVFDLAQLSEFYRPKTVPEDLSFKEIHLKIEYVSYCYADTEQVICAAFTWFREMPPEVHMNVDDLGAISIREIEHNGIRYVFLEWADPETGTSGDSRCTGWMKANV